MEALKPDLSTELRTRLLDAGTATVYEACGGHAGALPSHIKGLRLDTVVLGRALPVHLPPGDNLQLHRAIYAARPGDVLVVETGGAPEHGYFGEVMARAAQARAIGGLVIDGGVRDSARICDLGFPVFAACVCVRGTTKRPEGQVPLGTPIVIGDCTVGPSDVVFGDGDGAVVIPQDLVAEAAVLAEQREAKEREIFTQLAAGATTLDIYRLP